MAIGRVVFRLYMPSLDRDVGQSLTLRFNFGLLNLIIPDGSNHMLWVTLIDNLASFYLLVYIRLYIALVWLPSERKYKLWLSLTFLHLFQITTLEPMIIGLQEALPKSIGLLPFDGGVTGNWGYTIFFQFILLKFNPLSIYFSYKCK